MPLRCQTELERWHRQLSKRADRPSAGCAKDTPNQIDVAMQLARTVSALRSEPDGPELYRLNDAANELMRMLPVTHSTRKAAAREGLVLPGRPNYRYFGRCAELRYVVEAVQSLHAEKTEGPELAAETATAEAAAPSAMSTKQNGGLTVQLLARPLFRLPMLFDFCSIKDLAPKMDGRCACWFWTPKDGCHDGVHHEGVAADWMGFIQTTQLQDVGHHCADILHEPSSCSPLCTSRSQQSASRRLEMHESIARRGTTLAKLRVAAKHEGRRWHIRLCRRGGLRGASGPLGLEFAHESGLLAKSLGAVADRRKAIHVRDEDDNDHQNLQVARSLLQRQDFLEQARSERPSSS